MVIVEQTPPSTHSGSPTQEGSPESSNKGVVHSSSEYVSKPYTSVSSSHTVIAPAPKTTLHVLKSPAEEGGVGYATRKGTDGCITYDQAYNFAITEGENSMRDDFSVCFVCEKSDREHSAVVVYEYIVITVHLRHRILIWAYWVAKFGVQS